jgi:hypothetical protein
VNPAATQPIELRLAPGRSTLAHRLLLLLIAIAALAVFFLVRSVFMRGSEPVAWIGFLLGVVLSWRLWLTARGLQRIPIPHEITFRGDGRIIVRPDPQSAPIECIPGALVLAGNVLAFTFCPSIRPGTGRAAGPLGQGSAQGQSLGPSHPPPRSFKNIHWMSGVDAIGDENWRRLRVWLVWNRRARKIRR